MRNMVWAALALVPAVLLAEAIVPPTTEEILALVAAIGGLKGAGALAIAAFAAQAVLILARSGLGAIAGKWQLAIIYGVTVVSGVIGQRLAGVELLAAFLNASVMSAIQVFVYELIKQIKQPAAQA